MNFLHISKPRSYEAECYAYNPSLFNLADKKLCSMKTKGFGQTSTSSSWKRKGHYYKVNIKIQDKHRDIYVLVHIIVSMSHRTTDERLKIVEIYYKNNDPQ